MIFTLLSPVAFAGYYEDLEIAIDSSKADIEKAFRRLSLRWSPDKNPGNPAAEAKFRSINKAYEVLSDYERRNDYDRELVPGRSLSAGREPWSDAQRESLLKQFPAYRSYIKNEMKIMEVMPDKEGVKMIKAFVGTDDPRLHGLCAMAILMTHPDWVNHFDLVLELIRKGHANADLASSVFALWWKNEKGAIILKAMIDAGYGHEVVRSLGITDWPSNVDGKIVKGGSWFATPYGRPLLDEILRRGMTPRTSIHVFGDRETVRGFTGDANSTRFDGAILEELRRLRVNLRGHDLTAKKVKAEILSGDLRVIRKGDIKITSEQVEQLLGDTSCSGNL